MSRRDDIRISDGSLSNAAALAERSRSDARARAGKVAALAAVFVVVVVAGMLLPGDMFLPHRSPEMSLAEFLKEFGDKAAHLLAALTGGDASVGVVGYNGRSLYENGLMTSVVAAVAGGALGMCGSVYQGALRNPLAAPKTLGVMSGGALGSLLYFMVLAGPVDAWLDMPALVSEHSGAVDAGELAAYIASLNPAQWFWFMYGKCLVSMVGCLAIVAVVLLIASFVGRGKLSNITLIISGQVFSVSITGLILFCRYWYTQQGDFGMSESLKEIETYALGGPFRYEDLLVIVAPLAAMMLVVFLMRNRLTMLSFGDAEAQSMGVNVNQTRYAMVALCTVMTGWAISFAGHIAFLGFISAHLARRIVGPDMRYLLPASVFVGGAFESALYILTTMGLPFAPAGSVGMYTSILGAAAFLAMALRQRGKGSGDWR